MNGGGGAGGSRGDGTVATTGIPAGVRKMVQSLKEIVNLPDQEIYGTLKECGMDPSEAVQRLLSQDSFHEVKSKRDKKKEMKELPDFRSRTTNNNSGHGIRGISDRAPRSSSIQSSSNGYYEGSRAKAAQKKEDGSGSVSSSSNMGSSSSISRKSTIISEHASSENLSQAIGSADGSALHSQPSSGYPHTWAGMPGHFSMADIVKMGRPQGKLSASAMVAGNSSHFSPNHITSDTSDKYSVNPVRPSELDQRVHSSQGPHQPVEDIDIEPRTTRNEHVSDDGWPSVNQSNSGIASAILETSEAAISYSDPSNVELVVDEAQLHQTLNEDEIPELDQCSNSESLLESESISDREIQVNSSEDKSKLDDGSLQNMSAYLSQRHLFEQQVDDVNVEISSAAANLQNLRLQKDGLTAPSLEDNPAVIIPRHLQVTNADCSHLSFGSFGSGIGTSFSGSLQPKPLHDNSEVANVSDDPSLNHSEARNSSYYENDELKSQINEDARAGMVNYDMPSASEPELIRDDAVNTTHELQYNFPSLSGYGTSTSAQHSATAFSHPQTNLQMQNFASLSTLMQPYTSSLPSSLLAPTLQPLRDIDLPFSSLLAPQSLSTKHSATTSINGPSISIPEPKPNVFSNLQQVPQSSSSSNLPAGHAIPQHLHINPYSQATLPLGPFPNVISYPFLPQSYTYLPSAAFPQAYPSNGPFHQSTSAVHNAGLKYTLPQYKSSLSGTGLPQPATVASAYGNYNGSTNVPGNFVLNPSTTSTSTTLGFDEALSSQKEGAHYLQLQQNESSPMWVHNGNSRTMSALPPNTFYGFQGQNQLNNFRQAQQSAHYGPMGYLNLYQNHQLGGQTQEHQQNPGEANLNSSQGNSSSQPSHQIWQHGY